MRVGVPRASLPTHGQVFALKRHLGFREYSVNLGPRKLQPCGFCISYPNPLPPPPTEHKSYPRKHPQVLIPIPVLTPRSRNPKHPVLKLQPAEVRGVEAPLRSEGGTGRPSLDLTPETLT